MDLAKLLSIDSSQTRPIESLGSMNKTLINDKCTTNISYFPKDFQIFWRRSIFKVVRNTKWLLLLKTNSITFLLGECFFLCFIKKIKINSIKVLKNLVLKDINRNIFFQLLAALLLYSMFFFVASSSFFNAYNSYISHHGKFKTVIIAVLTVL